MISLLSFAQDCKSTVYIKTDIEYSELYIDSSFSNSGNEFILELEPGQYLITLVENSKQWNSRSLKDTIKISDCTVKTFNYSFQPRVLLDSSPQNVYVIKSDSLTGFTPVWLEDDFQTILLKKPDYSDLTISRSELALETKPELKFTGEFKGEEFYESALFKILTGTLIALGATTAYYKLEADDSFEEYKITGDPALQEQTEKYDVISGVTFVAMQLNFGLLLYLFLTD